MGLKLADIHLRNAYVGEEIIDMKDPADDLENSGYYMGTIDGNTIYGDIIGVGPVEDFVDPPSVPAADKDRRSLSIKEWMKEFFETTSIPIGHGFTEKSLENVFASYSFEPKSDVPLKVIVLDDTQNEDKPVDVGYAQGYLDKARYNWLIKELDQGQKENKLMVIAAHIPISAETEDEDTDSYLSWSSNAYVSEEDLVAKLHEYSNLILWIAGHNHSNKITPFVSPDPKHQELGFWQVETTALLGFPQHFRTFDIFRNSDNTVSIITSTVDASVKENSLAAISRSYAVAAQRIFSKKQSSMTDGVINAELFKQLSSEMQQVIKNYEEPVN